MRLGAQEVHTIIKPARYGGHRLSGAKRSSVDPRIRPLLGNQEADGSVYPCPRPFWLALPSR